MQSDKLHNTEIRTWSSPGPKTQFSVSVMKAPISYDNKSNFLVIWLPSLRLVLGLGVEQMSPESKSAEIYNQS